MAKRRGGGAEASSDMTPMIDMVFQLLIFFMILINFSEADQNQRVNLPVSDLAKPPEKPIKDSFTLHVAKADKNDPPHLKYVILIGAEKVTTPDELDGILPRIIDDTRLKSSKATTQDVTVVVRADSEAQTGYVQEVIQTCQKHNLEKFVLRAAGKE